MPQERNKPIKQITLSESAIERVDEMAKRTRRSRSAMIEWLIFEAEMPPKPRTTGE
jgi:metal-responsive CopG/Arc/MetJ family transcriptional regulator